MCNLNLDISSCVTSWQDMKLTIRYQLVRSKKCSYWVHCVRRSVFSDIISRHFLLVQFSDFSLQGNMILMWISDISLYLVVFWLCRGTCSFCLRVLLYWSLCALSQVMYQTFLVRSNQLKLCMHMINAEVQMCSGVPAPGRGTYRVSAQEDLPLKWI